MSTNSKNNRQIDFIGIGAIKSGSTWVAECLAEHPQINFSSEKSAKEIHFFCSDNNPIMKGHVRERYGLGLEWYLQQFPPFEPGELRGEFCNSYLPDRVAGRRIRNDFPEVKLLVVLRNPVRMLYSLYWWFRASILRDVPDTFREFITQTGYKNLGLYAGQLSEYYQLFPTSNIRIWLLDDIKEDPAAVARQLYDYLGIDKHYTPSIINQKVNPALEHRSTRLKKLAQEVTLLFKRLGLQKLYYWLSENKSLWEIYKRFNLAPVKYPPMFREDQVYLEEFFLQDTRRLEELLERDLKEVWGY